MVHLQTWPSTAIPWRPNAAKMGLGGKRPRTLPINVDEVGDLLSPRPLKVKKSLRLSYRKKSQNLVRLIGRSDAPCRDAKPRYEA
jgi:hypothetical protein